MALNQPLRPTCVASGQLYALYKEWCESSGIDKPIQIKYFKPNLIDNVKYKDFVTCHRYKDGVFYKFDMIKFKNYYTSLIEATSDEEENEVWSE